MEVQIKILFPKQIFAFVCLTKMFEYIQKVLSKQAF